MRIYQLFEDIEGAVDYNVQPLFPNPKAIEKFSWDNNGLYVSDPHSLKGQSSVYFGAYRVKSGEYASSVWINKSAKARLQTDNELLEELPEHYTGDGGKAWMFLGVFDDPQDAAYCSQQIRFSENYEDYVILYFRQLYLDEGLFQRPWPPAVKGLPSWWITDSDTFFNNPDWKRIEQRKQLLTDVYHQDTKTTDRTQVNKNIIRRKEIETQKINSEANNKVSSIIGNLRQKAKLEQASKKQLAKWADHVINYLGLNLFYTEDDKFVKTLTTTWKDSQDFKDVLIYELPFGADIEPFV